MRVEESIVIDRPAEAVFGFLSVRTNDPVWMASVTESEWLDPAAPMGVGRRGRMVMQAMGRCEFLDEVTEYEPGSADRPSLGGRADGDPHRLPGRAGRQRLPRDRAVRARAPPGRGRGQADRPVDGEDCAPHLWG
jgi:hypothetical protein